MNYFFSIEMGDTTGEKQKVRSNNLANTGNVLASAANYSVF